MKEVKMAIVKTGRSFRKIILVSWYTRFFKRTGEPPYLLTAQNYQITIATQYYYFNDGYFVTPKQP
jgi:hypothetical protein